MPSIAGLTALKLQAWADRRLETRRDAVDLQTIIGWYGIGSALDGLYEEDGDLLATHDFDPAPASAHRLGRHAAELLGATAPLVAAVLDDDGQSRLVADMPHSVLDWAPLVRALARGLREIGAPSASELVARRRHIPDVDVTTLRTDLDAVLDMRT